MFEWIASPEAWVALGTLTALEIVLGIDNIIFITILVGRLPKERQAFARNVGLLLAMGARLGLLFTISWIIGLTAPWFSVFGHEVTGRALILVAGGLFLLAKSTHEIHAQLDDEPDQRGQVAKVTLGSVLLQIAVLDLVFSLDSVITAVGLAKHVPVMAIAIIIAVGVMMLSARAIGSFVERNPTIKMLALAFLILVGVTLMVEAFDVHVPKGYIYFAMAFSVGVEMLNIRMRKARIARRRKRPAGEGTA